MKLRVTPSVGGFLPRILERRTLSTEHIREELSHDPYHLTKIDYLNVPVEGVIYTYRITTLIQHLCET